MHCLFRTFHLQQQTGRRTAYHGYCFLHLNPSPLRQPNSRSKLRAMSDPVEELQRNPREAKNRFLTYLKDDFFRLNFYRAHMLYFVVVIAISSVIVYGEGVKNGPKEYRDSHLSYMDALFLTCSAMTTTGKCYSRRSLQLHVDRPQASIQSIWVTSLVSSRLSCASSSLSATFPSSPWSSY